MTKTLKITGIKKAIGDYKDWKSYDWRRSAKIMIDVLSGEIWTDCFLDCNTWKNYHSSSISSLSSYIRQYTDKPFTIVLLKEYAIQLMSE